VRSRSSRRHPPIQHSAMAFMRGVRTLLGTVRMLASATHRVERGGQVRAVVADHELDLCVPGISSATVTAPRRQLLFTAARSPRTAAFRAAGQRDIALAADGPFMGLPSACG
jgi:hypothetical protein